MKHFLRSFGVVLFWLVWPLLWVYFRLNSRRTRLLLVCGEEFLALKGWLGENEWSMPGGGLHKGEVPLVGLIREVREETGITLKPSQLKPAFSAIHRDRGLSFGYECYVCQIDQKPTVNRRKTEISEYAWLPLDTNQKLTKELLKALEFYKKSS